MNNKKIKIIAIVIVSLIAVWGIYKIFTPKTKIQYRKETPVIGNITERVEAAGKINPVTQTSVGTQVSGRVMELYVDFNTVVKKGQLLAVIDPSTYESVVLQQQANLQRADSVFQNSRRNFERYQKLFADALVSKSDLDNAEVDFLSAQAQMTQAKAALDKAKIDLNYTRIVSPVDGIVISKEVELGQTVAASFQTPTLFLVAEDLTKMQIEVFISEADISKIKEGQDVEFSVDAYPDTTFKGVVSQVRNSPTTIQNVVTYTVVVAVDNKNMKLKPGMTANASIITARKKGILTVSNQALRFVPPPDAKIKEPAQQPKEEASSQQPRQRGSGGGQRGGQQGQKRSYQGAGVWIEHSNGMLERIDIETGITDGSKTEVVSGNITKDTQIITAVETGQKKAAQSGSSAMRMMRF